jgi:hypothetical protein
MRGGSNPGERRGGRQRGTKNKRTVAVERALADTAAKITGTLGAEAFQGDAHALLMAVYKDATQPIELRVLAAKAAIGYEKSRLATVENTGEHWRGWRPRQDRARSELEAALRWLTSTAVQR